MEGRFNHKPNQCMASRAKPSGFTSNQAGKNMRVSRGKARCSVWRSVHQGARLV